MVLGSAELSNPTQYQAWEGLGGGEEGAAGAVGRELGGGGAELPLVATPGEDPGRGRAGLGRRKLTMHALHQPGQAGTPPWAARGRGEGLCAEVGEGYHELRQLSSGAARNEASTLAGGPRTPGGRDPATARHGVDARELYPQRWRRGWPQWPLGAAVERDVAPDSHRGTGRQTHVTAERSGGRNGPELWVCRGGRNGTQRE